MTSTTDRLPDSNINVRVREEFERRGRRSYLEYPGVIHLPDEDTGFWTSDQNDTWTVDELDARGVTIGGFDTRIPRTETDVTKIANAIERGIVQYRLMGIEAIGARGIDVIRDIASRALSVIEESEGADEHGYLLTDLRNLDAALQTWRDL